MLQERQKLGLSQIIPLEGAEGSLFKSLPDFGYESYVVGVCAVAEAEV